MTLFSFEVPTPHLKDFAPHQDFNFALSMLYKDEAYFSHFKAERDKEDKELWLDNSFNELQTADSCEQLGNIAYWLNPNYTICPDAPEWTTMEIEDSFYKMCGFLPPEQLMVVVSNEFMYHQLHNNTQARKFAISYWVRKEFAFLDNLKWARDLHFLGCLSPDELIYLKPPSCDTSMPIKLALEGRTIKQWRKEGCPHIHTKDNLNFFELNLTALQLELALENVVTLKKVVNG